uniref:Uncharacterized protein n=1 Tax=Arundo donax TaxID=35708 RepID=A0A0A9D3B9_ARUDO
MKNVLWGSPSQFCIEKINLRKFLLCSYFQHAG